MQPEMRWELLQSIWKYRWKLLTRPAERIANCNFPTFSDQIWSILILFRKRKQFANLIYADAMSIFHLLMPPSGHVFYARLSQIGIQLQLQSTAIYYYLHMYICAHYIARLLHTNPSFDSPASEWPWTFCLIHKNIIVIIKLMAFHIRSKGTVPRKWNHHLQFLCRHNRYNVIK